MRTGPERVWGIVAHGTPGDGWVGCGNSGPGSMDLLEPLPSTGRVGVRSRVRPIVFLCCTRRYPADSAAVNRSIGEKKRYSARPVIMFRSWTGQGVDATCVSVVWVRHTDPRVSALTPSRSRLLCSADGPTAGACPHAHRGISQWSGKSRRKLSLSKPALSRS